MGTPCTAATGVAVAVEGEEEKHNAALDAGVVDTLGFAVDTTGEDVEDKESVPETVGRLILAGELTLAFCSTEIGLEVGAAVCEETLRLFLEGPDASTPTSFPSRS